MPTPTKGRRLGGSASHQNLMLANLSASLFEHKRITTTANKAKRLRPYAENLITLAKKGDLNSRRRVAALISNKTTVHELFTDIAETMAQREGGYTRITKIGNRKGDNAPMAVIELVTETVNAKPSVKKAAQAAPAVDEAPVEDAPVEETSAEEVETETSEDFVGETAEDSTAAEETSEEDAK